MCSLSLSAIDNASAIEVKCESFLEELKIGVGKDHLASTLVYMWVELKVTWEK